MRLVILRDANLFNLLGICIDFMILGIELPGQYEVEFFILMPLCGTKKLQFS